MYLKKDLGGIWPNSKKYWDLGTSGVPLGGIFWCGTPQEAKNCLKTIKNGLKQCQNNLKQSKKQKWGGGHFCVFDVF